MTIYVKDSGAWQNVTSVHNNIGGTWTEADQGVSVNDSGTWRTVHAAPGSQEYSTAGTYSFSIPEGVHVMKVSAAGAGGGAGGSYYTSSGQGGSGGGYVDTVEVECSSIATLSITVGAGGGGVQFGDGVGGTFGQIADDGSNTTIGGLSVNGNVTSSTVTLYGGGRGIGGNQSLTAGTGGSTSGITGGATGQNGDQTGTYGEGGYSLGGTTDSGSFGTIGDYQPSSCWGLDGDDSRGSAYATGKGAGGCGVPDGSSCGGGAFGGGGDGADGYVLLEWG